MGIAKNYQLIKIPFMAHDSDDDDDDDRKWGSGGVVWC